MILVLLLATCRAADEPARELHLLCWTEYVPPAVIEGFARKAGVKVVTANYNSNEQMLAMLKARPGYYDLVQPSQAYVTALIEGHGLEAIDRRRRTGEISIRSISGCRMIRTLNLACRGWRARWGSQWIRRR